MAGVQEVRTKIGNALLGARVQYGEPLFVTVSPSSRHSGLLLRLSRVRPNDPTLRLDDLELGEAQRLGSKDYPSLYQSVDTALLDIPEYAVRQRWQARDGLCGIEAFRVWIFRVLATIFGIRMCLVTKKCYSFFHICLVSFCMGFKIVYSSAILPPYVFCTFASAWGVVGSGFLLGWP